ncbi:WD40 repeat-like protein [Coprinellus micaceus]|uniref:WD40 repeat-like protein n=1 Tax=Coprinellus micaceus TaxID=71717 RepID=A0A4Y7T8U7_COPMI|nr:WD40 repeat-like protein [Coprinellus micaceus]
MSSANPIEEDSTAQRPPSPPPHTTFEARGILPPTFSALKPRDYRMPGSQSYGHVAWSCDGKKLAAVGPDKTTRVWNPDKSVRASFREELAQIEYRSATTYSGAHSEDVDYVSWNPTHPDLFCTSSSRDRRIVFWDARQSRNIQVYLSKYSPVQTCYSPNGRELLGISATNALFFMNLGRDKPEDKEQWRSSDREPKLASMALWNHAGTGILTALHSESSIRAIEYPSLGLHKTSPAHVGGVTSLALDPRGRYLASGGVDSIVNLFDLEDWISARTITSCEHSINSISFSSDGEYLAISTTGSYLEICATETGLSLHRVSTPAPAPVVAWHPSRYVVAYCGQIGGPPPISTISMFGLLE